MIAKDRLQELRKDAGLTQKELGDKLKVSPKTIGCYERQEVSPPDDVKIEMAKLFNVSLDYLLGLIDEEISFSRSDVVVLPKGFPPEAIPKVTEYVGFIMTDYKSKK